MVEIPVCPIVSCNYYRTRSNWSPDKPSATVFPNVVWRSQGDRSRRSPRERLNATLRGPKFTALRAMRACGSGRPGKLLLPSFRARLVEFFDAHLPDPGTLSSYV